MKRALFFLTFLLHSITTFNLTSLPVLKCHKGYYISPMTMMCQPIPGPLCDRVGNKEYFFYGQCKIAKKQSCPIKKCYSKSVLFKELCMCITPSSKRLVMYNYYFRKYKERFVLLYNKYIHVNSRIANCFSKYEIKGNKCVLRKMRKRCRNKCKKGFQNMSQTCKCVRIPTCEIKKCKRGYKLVDCKCEKDEKQIIGILKRLGIYESSQAAKNKQKEQKKNNKTLPKKTDEKEDTKSKKKGKTLKEMMKRFFNIKAKHSRLRESKGILDNLMTDIKSSISKKKKNISICLESNNVKLTKEQIKEKLQQFNLLIRMRETLSRKLISNHKVSIEKCKFGYFLDFPKNRCEQLESGTCSLKCKKGLYAVPGLCLCMEVVECPVESCVENFSLNENCQCVPREI